MKQLQTFLATLRMTFNLFSLLLWLMLVHVNSLIDLTHPTSAGKDFRIRQKIIELYSSPVISNPALVKCGD